MTASRDRLKNFAEVCDFLTVLVAACTARGPCAACGGFGFARNDAAFDVFYRLQVTNFQVTNFGLLNSAPNRADYSHIRRSVLHGRYRIADLTQYSQRFFDRPTSLKSLLCSWVSRARARPLASLRTKLEPMSRYAWLRITYKRICLNFAFRNPRLSKDRSKLTIEHPQSQQSSRSRRASRREQTLLLTHIAAAENATSCERIKADCICRTRISDLRLSAIISLDRLSEFFTNYLSLTDLNQAEDFSPR